MSIAKIYCKEVRKNFKKYFGNWEPTDMLSLGDYGVIEDDIFIHKGNISSFGINALTTEEQIDVGSKTFSSKGSVSINLKPKISAQSINASAEISFSKKDSVYINALNCSTQRFSNKTLLGEKILELYKKKKKWKRNWVVVTDLIMSKNTTIVISENAGSSISFEAKNAGVSAVDLGDVNLSLSMTNNKEVGYHLATKPNITPFFCICGIEDPWFRDAKFEPIVTKSYMPSFGGGGTMGFMAPEIVEFGEIE